jgi:TonB family protein
VRGWEASQDDTTVLPPPDDFSPTEYPWSQHGRERERLRRKSTRFVRRALIVAAMAHAVIFGAVQIRRHTQPKVVVVSLKGNGYSQVFELTGGVRKPRTNAPPPIVEKPKTPPPAEKVPPKKLSRQGTVKVKPSEKKGKDTGKEAPPAKTPPQPEEEFAAADAGAGAGFASGVPGMGVDNPDFKYAWYLLQVRNKISANWIPVGGAQGKTYRVVLHFRILRNGRVEGVVVEEPSGRSEFDRSAMSALVSASPFPPLPADFGDDVLGIHFGFTHTQ